MPIKFLLLGGGSGFFRRGGVEVPILILWAGGVLSLLIPFEVRLRSID